MPLSPGNRLGPYEVLAAAGAGGMGEVYRARDSRLDRAVAIKLLPAHLAARDDLRQRFQNEARAIARLQHPNICAVFDVGEEGGVDYLVMEYLEGETLEKQLERGPLPVSEAVRLGAQIAAGLDAAHRAGITHRDLKPGNVMITKSGAKLLDFGLAKLSHTAPLATDGSTVVTMTKALTVEGTIVGTFQYMAPEQLEGEEADARTDVFAFGLVLYEIVTGRKAFQGKSQATLISAIVSSDPPSITAVQPAAPPALERAILRCLAKDRDERWQTARDLCRELEWIATGGSQAGPPVPAVRRRAPRLPWVIAAVALVAAVAMSWLYVRKPAADLPLVQFRVSLPTRLPVLAGPSVSPDGRLAAVWLGGWGDWQVHIYSLASGELRPLPNATRMTAAAWSRDSRYLAGNITGVGLRKIEVSTGAASTLTSGTMGMDRVAWNRDGVLLYSTGAVLYRLPSGGGGAEKVLTLPAGESFRHIEFLPDNDRFLLNVAVAGGFEARVGSLRGGNPQIVAPNAIAYYASPGHLLLHRGDSLLLQKFDPRSLAVSGTPVTVASAVDQNWMLTPSVSENGLITFHRLAAASGQQMTWCDRSGNVVGTLGAVGNYSNPVISPDGKRVAVALESGTLKRDVWVYDLVRGGAYRLTLDPADDFTPNWSPDGRYIVFGSDRRGKRDIYRKFASGTGEEELLYASATEDKVAQSWSPDGQRLWLVLVDPNTRQDIYQFSLADRKLEKYIGTPFNESNAQLSPDGRWLVYQSRESGRDEIYLQPYPATGERWQVSTAGGKEPQWRGDSRELYYVAGDTITAVDIKPAGKSVEIGVPHPLFEGKLQVADMRNRYVTASDGRKFLVLRKAQDETSVNGFDTVINWPELVKPK